MCHSLSFKKTAQTKLHSLATDEDQELIAHARILHLPRTHLLNRRRSSFFVSLSLICYKHNTMPTAAQKSEPQTRAGGLAFLGGMPDRMLQKLPESKSEPTTSVRQKLCGGSHGRRRSLLFLWRSHEKREESEKKERKPGDRMGSEA